MLEECKLSKLLRNFKLLIVELDIKMDSVISRIAVFMVINHTKVQLEKSFLKFKVLLDLVN